MKKIWNRAMRRGIGFFDPLKLSTEKQKQLKHKVQNTQESLTLERNLDENREDEASLAPRHDSIVNVSTGENIDRDLGQPSPLPKSNANKAHPSPAPEASSSLKISPIPASDADHVIPATPSSTPTPTPDLLTTQVTSEHFDPVRYLSIDPSFQARTSFLVRLILDVLIFSYTVPGTQLLLLPHPPPDRTRYGAVCWLNNAEQEFAEYLACLVELGVGTTKESEEREELNDKGEGRRKDIFALAPYHMNILKECIVRPCRELGVPVACVFALLEDMFEHGLEPAKRYRAFPEVLLDMILHEKDGEEVQYALAKRIVTDLSLLDRAATEYSSEMRNLVAGKIEKFGVREFGHGWWENLGKERGFWFGLKANRLAGSIASWIGDTTDRQDQHQKESVLDESLKLEWQGIAPEEAEATGKHQMRSQEDGGEAKQGSPKGVHKKESGSVDEIASLEARGFEVVERETLIDDILRLLR
ncbi:hypothetical protein FB567DRAFT_626201 [Paraphoma chrysanthemicola]|uniref:Uncharacterized protein n=1 Tax=Paraphoma chrysanthemicola TaxID=798071 RepID=A0A8K0RC52_9PLEO|nr:hypothetical protein FB567DRAFT_626201 [Paraphoma chrysanthemicola]